MGVQVETEYAQVLRLPDGITEHRSGVHAACSMSDAMPNPGLRRMLAAWQRPELFLGAMIRHRLAPAEDRNTTDLDKIRPSIPRRNIRDHPLNSSMA
jgi:hypothetical protein